MSRMVIVALACMLGGCALFRPKFDSYICFRNESDESLYVEANGFERSPACGVLLAHDKGHKGSFMGRMAFPSEVVLTWRYWDADLWKFSQTRTNVNTTILSINSLLPDRGNGELIFLYTTNHQWVVSIKK